MSELLDLIKAKILPVGTVLYHRGRSGSPVEARVTSRGLKVGGQVFSSPSSAARAKTASEINGWAYWRLSPSGDLLETLRQTPRRSPSGRSSS
jgi:hypothetical protein